MSLSGTNRGSFGGVKTWIWAALLLTALLARVSHRVTHPVIQRDGVTFLSLARVAREGNPGALLQHDQHPLYPAVTALLQPILRDWEVTGVAISILSSVLTVIPVVLLGIRVAGPAGGVAGGWLFAVARYPVQYGGAALSDGLHVFFFASAAWAGAVALGLNSGQREPAPGSGRSFFLSGLFAGLAYLVRPEGLIIVVALFFASLVQLVTGKRGHRSGARWVRGQALVALALIITAGPYAAHLSLESGQLTLTRKKSILKTLNAGLLSRPPLALALAGPEGEADGKTTEKDTEKDSVKADEKETRDVKHFLSPRLVGAYHSLGQCAEGMGWIPAGCLVFGLIRRRRRRDSILAELYLFTPLIGFVILLSGVYITEGYVGRRHLYPLTPVLEGWAGLGLVTVTGFLGGFLGNVGRQVLGRKMERRSWVPTAIAMIAILAMLPKSTGWIPSSGKEKDLWTRQVGYALRDTIGPGETILSPGATTRVAFYTGSRVIHYHAAEETPELRELCSAARERHAGWVLAEAAPGARGQTPPGGWKIERRIPRGDEEGEILVVKEILQ